MVLVVVSMIIVFVAVSIGGYNYLLNEGVFNKWSHPTIQRESLEKHGVMYFGYGFRWKGHGSSTISDVYLVKSDGKILQKNNEQISITPFIQPHGGNTIGVTPKEVAVEEGLIDNLTPIGGTSINNDGWFRLVLKVELLDENYSKDFNSLIIEYKYLGFNRTQHFDFDGFLSEDNG